MNKANISPKNKKKYILYGIFAVYILALLKIILFKTSSFSDILNSNFSAGYRSVNLIPLKTVFDFFILESTDFLRAFSNIIGNIGIFLPLGYLLPMLFKKFNKLSSVTLASMLLSLTFELIQFLLSLGSCDIDDLILNTLGGFLGYIIYSKLKNHIGSEKKFINISIFLSIFAFIVAFTIAKEEFGNILGLTTSEVITVGAESIPNKEPSFHGTYLSIKEGKIEMYSGYVTEDSPEKTNLSILNVNITENTEFYLMSAEETGKNKSTITYKPISKEEASNISSYSNINAWSDESTPDSASIVVLSERMELEGQVMESN